MKKPLALAVCLTALLPACGSDDQPLAVSAARVDVNAEPAAPVAAGTLAKIADSATAQRRIGFVNVKALASVGGPIPAAEVQSLVLGTAGSARLDEATSAPTTAVQIGDATVLGLPEERMIIGGSSALRASLGDESSETSVITEETQSAVQSCLGEAAAQVIVGPAVAGKWAAIGAGVVDDADQPSGPKLRLCAAPHWVREVHALEKQLSDAFPATGDPALRPVVAEMEIGEREMVSATVSLKTIDPTLLRDYLAGGPGLVELIKP